MRSTLQDMRRARRFFAGAKPLVLGLLLALGTMLAHTRVANAQAAFVSLDTEDTKAILNHNERRVTVTGSVVCHSNQTFIVSAVVQQGGAGANVAGAGNTDPVACNGSPQPFAVQVEAHFHVAGALEADLGIAAHVEALSPRNSSYHRGPASIVLAADILQKRRAPAVARGEKVTLAAELRLNEGALVSEIRKDQKGGVALAAGHVPIPARTYGAELGSFASVTAVRRRDPSAAGATPLSAPLPRRDKASAMLRPRIKPFHAACG